MRYFYGTDEILVLLHFLVGRTNYFFLFQFVDDDHKCYLDTSYHFEIQKNWPTPI